MKFTFEVSNAQDLEKIRKLVKKVGQELIEDPDLAEKFIESLKSQGAVAMNGANFVIGVKFICRPNEQWLIRRKAYVALQRVFAEQKVDLSKPRVFVTSDEPAGASATTAEKATAASVAISG
jgi:small-conductance mechanosensitive channel